MYERQIAEQETEAGNDELWSGDATPTLVSENFTMTEMYNPMGPFGERRN